MELGNRETRGELFRMEEGQSRAFGFTSFLFGAAVGSLAMYLLDPFQGRRRRALLRDKGLALSHDVADFSRKHARDLANRSQGMIARLRQSKEEAADDSVLVSRVRSRFGRKVSHPKAVHVEAQDGVVTLRGHVLADELDGLLAAVESVDGVRQVENRLEAHREAGNIPSLQGQSPDYLH